MATRRRTHVGGLPVGVDPLTVDPRLKHDGTERDDQVEAILSALCHTKDVDGKRLRCSASPNEMVQMGRAISDHLHRYGYKIVPKDAQ